jgi:S-adenosyl-L-methionine hydrolase (adenosine-forming)
MPIITLTSDIGQQDFLIGAIKGQIYSVMPTTNVVDITHYLPQDNFAHAAYICKNAFKFFPSDSFHLVLLNTFDTNSNHFVLAKINGQCIICPDNGIISMIAAEMPNELVTIPIINARTLTEITQLIVHAIAAITSGKSMKEVGTAGLAILEKSMLRPMIGNDWMEGQILFIDNFENAIINITQAEFENERKGRGFKIIFKRNEIVDKISDNYTAVNEGESLAWFNSAGYLELSINKGNVAGLFGLENFNEKMHKQGTAVQNKWVYQTVRIFFE